MRSLWRLSVSTPKSRLQNDRPKIAGEGAEG
jgi:hypothetical protein